MTNAVEIMDKSAIKRALTRISHEIIEKNKGARNIALIGIQRRGVPLAKYIAAKMQEVEGHEIPVGILDITLYRDDLSLLSEHPVINGTDIGFTIQEKTLILVDDVIYTGRTVRAAIEALMDIGRPQSIQLAVLIDRGHRELPVRADFVGKNVPTSKNEIIHVHVKEVDGDDVVTLSERLNNK